VTSSGQSCIQTATVTCIAVPTKGLRGIEVNYNGRGTQPADVGIVGIAALVIVAGFALAARLNR
jgi:hypothetical protein